MIKEGIKKVIVNGHLMQIPRDRRNARYFEFDFTNTDSITKQHYLGKKPNGWKVLDKNLYANILLVSMDNSNITLKCDTLGTIANIEIF